MVVSRLGSGIPLSKLGAEMIRRELATGRGFGQIREPSAKLSTFAVTIPRRSPVDSRLVECT